MDNFFFIIVAGSFIIFAAFFIRALTGFGGALISIPLLVLFVDLKFAVPLESLFEVGLSALLLPKVYSKISKTTLIPLLIGALLGSLVGAYFLYTFNNILLKRALGLVIILFALNMLVERRRRSERSVSATWGGLAGAAGGIFGGLFGTSGPPFVMYLAYKLKEKETLRASLIGLFAVDYAWRVGVFAVTGLLTAEILRFALILTPALVLGTVLGHRVQVHINERRFRQLVALILIISGGLLLFG